MGCRFLHPGLNDKGNNILMQEWIYWGVCVCGGGGGHTPLVLARGGAGGE